jgi:5'-methylthioadenosine phosphorylase
MITDYDSWHPDHGTVDIAEIIATLGGNADKGARAGGAPARPAGGTARPARTAATGRSTTPS